MIEDELKVGIEYYLDDSDSKEDRGIFLRTDDTNVYFKKTAGSWYLDTDGVIGFVKTNFNYQEVIK